MDMYGWVPIGIESCLWCKYAMIHPGDPSVGIFKPYIEDCKAEHINNKVLGLLENYPFDVERLLPSICGRFTSRELNTKCICGEKIQGEEYLWQWWGDYGEPLCNKCYSEFIKDKYEGRWSKIYERSRRG